jgi:hypothetical protein
VPIWKLWGKKETPEASPSGVTKIDIALSDSGLQQKQRKMQVLAWRDEHEVKVLNHLKKATPEFKDRLLTLIQSIPNKAFFLRQKKSLEETIQPAIENWIQEQSVELLTQASGEVLNIVDTVGGVNSSDHSLNTDGVSRQLGDLATALGPLAAGIMSVPATVMASVVSAGGIAGFFGATVIAWPAVIVGTAVIGTMALLGGYRMAGIRTRANKRVHNKLSESIDRMVFGGEGQDLYLCAALQGIIRETAREQLIKEA